MTEPMYTKIRTSIILLISIFYFFSPFFIELHPRFQEWYEPKNVINKVDSVSMVVKETTQCKCESCHRTFDTSYVAQVTNEFMTYYTTDSKAIDASKTGDGTFEYGYNISKYDELTRRGQGYKAYNDSPFIHYMGEKSVWVISFILLIISFIGFISHGHRFDSYAIGEKQILEGILFMMSYFWLGCIIYQLFFT